ncbi:hypothetical protein FQN51_000919 [Onygenales sp. PD_10]|nr:hypothetical protein FQN51_000919 [Onygenales sp. PD_10]
MLRSAKAVVSARGALGAKMAGPMVNGSLHNEPRKSTYTTTALKRWSCGSGGDLPTVPQIKTIHVYDFDNTLFSSPLPNPQLWNGPTIGFLSTPECFANGGWWHDPSILAATGKGLEAEEPVQLVQLSMQQKDALTVLLTGRAEGPFENIIKRMVNSRNLTFDLVCLKPEVGPNSQRFSSTMNFKQTFLQDLVVTYKQAEEIRVYEDRVNHVKGFREYFERLNRLLVSSPPPLPRKPINAEVIQVTEGATFLSPITEAAEIQRMINAHNQTLTTAGNTTKSPYGRLRIKKNIFFTGYLLSNTDSSRIINYIVNPLLPPNLADSNEVKYMANSILITPRPPHKSLLDRVGGIGKTVKWRITDTGVFENKLWAARVTPVSSSEVIHTENPEPIMILAMKKGARPIDAGKIRNWQPVQHDDALVFDTTVGQKMALRVEEEHPDDGEWDSLPNRNNKRRQPQQDLRDDEPPQYMRENRDGPRNYPTHQENPYHGRSNAPYQRHYGDGGGGGGGRFHENDGPRRGGGGGGNYRGGRGRGRGGRGRGRGRGGREGGGPPSQYRSLDDHASGGGGYDGPDDRGFGGGAGGAPVMNY